MKIKFLKKTKDTLEIESDDNVLPNVLCSALTKNDVDAYYYIPHPLLPRHVLHIDAKEPMEKLRSAVSSVESDWTKFGKLLKAGMESR